jgi:hypothetical protein
VIHHTPPIDELNPSETMRELTGGTSRPPGFEIGQALPFPARSIEQDFCWAPEHPVMDAYRNYAHAL